MKHMDASNERVELFGGSNSWSLDAVYDTGTQSYRVPWLTEQELSGLDPLTWKERAQGQGGIAAILDTGVLTHHPLLQPRVLESMNFTGEGAEDQNGHGTMVALILALTSPSVGILSAKVYADDSAPRSKQAERIAQGLQWAVSRGANVVNLSLGFSRRCGEDDAVLCAAVEEAIARNVFVVVAAEAKCPAECHPDVIVVGTWDHLKHVVVANTPPDLSVFDARDTVPMIPYELWAQRVGNI